MGCFFEKVAVVRRPPRLPSAIAIHAVAWTAVFLFLAVHAPAQYLADGIAAVVNDKVITNLQVGQASSETEKLLRQNFSGEDLYQRVLESRLNVLRALIERELIIQDFKKEGGTIPETYVNQRLNGIIREEYGGDHVLFIKTIHDRGVTVQKFREEIENNAVVGYMRNKNIVQTVLVSPYQIEQYYQQNLRLFQQDEKIKIATIVLRKSATLSEKTDANGKTVSYDPQLEIAKEILYKLDTGTDFADLAKSYSEGSNKDEGGELGWVTQTGKSAIRTDLWPAIAKLQPGQHTEVLATEDGFYYILLVEDRTKASIAPLETVRAQIEQTVVGEASQLRQQEWLDSLRAKAFIKMF